MGIFFHPTRHLVKHAVRLALSHKTARQSPATTLLFRVACGVVLAVVLAIVMSCGLLEPDAEVAEVVVADVEHWPGWEVVAAESHLWMTDGAGTLTVSVDGVDSAGNDRTLVTFHIMETYAYRVSHGDSAVAVIRMSRPANPTNVMHCSGIGKPPQEFVPTTDGFSVYVNCIPGVRVGG